MQLSDIQASPDELRDYYAQLREQHVAPAWIGGSNSIEPRSEAVPYLWRWRDLRAHAVRAAELVGTQQAERRVLRLTNPNLDGAASNTLVANIQIVMPGEIARAHRHSAAALRLIIEGRGGYTVVNGERVPMSPGDLVLTPSWSWHDHANDTGAPMIWLDGLDTPLHLGGRSLRVGHSYGNHTCYQTSHARKHSSTLIWCQAPDNSHKKHNRAATGHARRRRRLLRG